jgi:septum formation protein
MYPRIVLASASPRRAELLRQVGVAFDVVPADIVERHPVGMPPGDAARQVACDKVTAVADLTNRELPVLAADTVVILDDEALGKPRDDDEARAMLSRLSGRTHTVATGVALIGSGEQRVESWLVETAVTFRAVDAAEIDAYVATGRPLDKAGAYGIQEDAAAFVEAVDGCYYAVVGLPLADLTRRLMVMQRKRA